MIHWNYAKRLCAIVFLSLVPHFACASSCHCQAIDYCEAVAISQDTGLPLLLIFTGSDWNAPSMKLRNELLGSPHIVEELDQNFVMIELDFPKYRAQDEKVQQQNVEVQAKYGVETFPCILLASPKEEEIYRMSGLEFESAAHIGHMLTYVMESNKTLSELIPVIDTLAMSDLEKFYKLADEVSNTKFMSVAMNQGVENDGVFFLQEKFRTLVEEGKVDTEECQQVKARLLEKDPNNEQMVHFTVALIEFQGLAKRLKQGDQLEPVHVIAPLEAYLSSSFGQEDKENQWRIEMLIAQFFLDFDHWSSALEHATVAFNAAPNEKRSDISRSLNYIRHQS